MTKNFFFFEFDNIQNLKNKSDFKFLLPNTNFFFFFFF